MADGSRYYWIKLRTDFFNQQTIDFILSQKNGCEYIVLYQMLCLQTANNNGELSTKIGEIIIPYDVDKIVRDTKYFDFDTVTIAIELFKKLGLIYESDDSGTLRIADYSMMIGSESASKSAVKKRKYRASIKEKNTEGDIAGDIAGDIEGDKMSDRYIDIRDKRLDIRDKDNRDKILYNMADKSASAPKCRKFAKPSLEEVKAYCAERQNNVNAERFIDYYESNGWKVGKNSMKDWKAAVRNWENRQKSEAKLPTVDDYDFSDWYGELK